MRITLGPAATRCRHQNLVILRDIVPTLLHAGEWEVTYPRRAQLTCEVTYLPTRVDDEGTGKAVEREVFEWIARATQAGPRLAEHPPQWLWDCDIVPAGIPPDHPVVATAPLLMRWCA